MIANANKVDNAFKLKLVQKTDNLLLISNLLMLKLKSEMKHHNNVNLMCYCLLNLIQ